MEFPDRFLIGTDTFTPERWYYIAEHADWSRAWLAAGLATAAAQAACPPDAADGTVVRKNGLLLAWRPVVGANQAATASRIPMAKHFALEVQLCDKDDVSAARLQKADATMPEHRHGMNYRPVITPLGGGRFRRRGLQRGGAGPHCRPRAVAAAVDIRSRQSRVGPCRSDPPRP